MPHLGQRPTETIERGGRAAAILWPLYICKHADGSDKALHMSLTKYGRDDTIMFNI